MDKQTAESVRDFIVQFPLYSLADHLVSSFHMWEWVLAMLAQAALWVYGRYRSASPEWRAGLWGAVIALTIMVVGDSVQFAYQRYRADPRALVAWQRADFLRSLGRPDQNEIFSVGCISDDPSSCKIAADYRNLLSDQWSLGTNTCATLEPRNPGLLGRIWIETRSEKNRPAGALALHRSLEDFGLNPGAQLCPAFGANEFSLTVGMRKPR